MQRYLWIALVLTSCAKSSKEGAPGSTTGAGDKSNASPPPADTAAPSPTTTPKPPSDSEALEHARAGASLGVSAETDAFDETGSGGKVNRRRRPEEKEQAKDDKGSSGGGGPGAPAKPATAHAQIGAVTVGGKPAADPLVQALKVRVSDVQACYDKAAKPDLIGALEITFTVLPTGALANASVKSTTLKNMAVESCVVGVIQGIKVAKSAAETKASVAITFAK